VKDILQQYALYNKWANDKVIDIVSTLPSALIDKTVESSFSSLRLTITHVCEADSTWWQRLHLAENIVSPVPDKTLPIDAILSEWKKQSLQWQEWVVNAKDVNLSHVIAYRNSKKEQFKQPVYQILLHLFNHATYHRGQIVTILHELGVEEKPHTDFILWGRSKK
jgi:uncharacterized damage-inducible protein DinB